MSKPGLYKMSTISERTGFSPALLRAWERRHALLDPERTDGGHRLYTNDDLAVLGQVRVLLEQGRAIGEIASLGRERLLAKVAPAAPKPASVELSPELGATLSDMGKALVNAAVAVDEAAVEGILDEAFVLLSPQVAMERVVMPALVTIGDLWSQGRCSVAGEHLASAKVVGRLLRLLETLNPALGNGARSAVVACLPDERHEVGPLMASCLLARFYHRVSYLGACMPLEDLERAIQQLLPDVLCLSVSRESLLLTHKPRLIETVERLPERTRVFLGGRGVTSSDPDLVAAGLILLAPGAPRLRDYLTGAHNAPAHKPRAKSSRKR